MAVPRLDTKTPLAPLRADSTRPWSDIDLPGTDEAARAHLASPMNPVLTREQAAAVRDADLD